MSNQEKYLKPEVIRQVQRLDLRARFIVEGFLSGLHSSPFHGFSAEFSEHQKYNPGDDIAGIDWQVYARTDRYYIRKFEAETNLTGYLMMDLSASMGYTHEQELTKFEYSICLAAALAYMMIRQSDAVGLVTFAEQVRDSLPPRSRRSQLSAILATLSKLQPAGESDIANALHQTASMIRHRSLVMLFSDLLTEQREELIRGLHHVRHRGNDVIVFHVLDAAEALFPFHGLVEFEDNETLQKEILDADGVRADYLEEVRQWREGFKKECALNGIDYLPLHTGMPFDHALLGYLNERQLRY